MKKRRYKVIGIFIALFLVIALVSYAYVGQGKQPQKKTEVSVVVHGDNTERWENFRQGVEQAAIDLNASSNFVVLGDDTDVKKQISLIQRELSAETQGMIISAVDSEMMAQTVNDAATKLPVVMAETSVFQDDGQRLEYVSADNQVMGQKLAQIIVENNDNSSPIYILKINEQRDSIIERERGLVQRLNEQGYTVHYWTPGEGDFNLSLFVQKMIHQSDAGIIVALDETTLEGVIDGNLAVGEQAVPKVVQHNLVYGIGSTAKIVYHLNHGSLEGIIFQDEYHMGYTSMERLMKMIQTKEEPGAQVQEIESYIANRQNLHLPEIERLLYPIIQ